MGVKAQNLPVLNLYQMTGKNAKDTPNKSIGILRTELLQLYFFVDDEGGQSMTETPDGDSHEQGVFPGRGPAGKGRGNQGIALSGRHGERRIAFHFRQF